MDIIVAIEIIRQKLEEAGGTVQIPKLKEGDFTAKLVNGGVEVDNLGNQPFLPWPVFQEALCLLIRNEGRAERGDAMNARLGDSNLSLDTIEGHIAQVVYGKRLGDSVFRRITPISCILIWAGLCEAEPNELLLKEKL